MGTRGLIGFIVKGQRRGTYNNMDSYPSGLGKDVVDFILSLDEEGIKEMQRLVENLIWVEEEDLRELDQEQAQRIYHHVPIKCERWESWRYIIFHAPEHKEIVHPRNNRELLLFIQNGQRVAVDQSDFIGSPFCEYAYLIDFENKIVEVDGIDGDTVIFPFGELKPGIFEEYENDHYSDERSFWAAQALLGGMKVQTVSTSQMDELVQDVAEGKEDKSHAGVPGDAGA